MGRSATYHFILRLLVVGLGLFPMLSSALGLGDIQLDSRLNQPFRAHIDVADITDEEWSHIRTRLHWQDSPEMPAAHPEILDTVTLRAVQDTAHRHFIEVRSVDAIAEPLFDLSVEVSAPTGRVIRSYAILLDPPAAQDDLPQGARAAVIHSAEAPQTAASASQSAAAGQGTQRSEGTLASTNVSTASNDAGMARPVTQHRTTNRTHHRRGASREHSSTQHTDVVSAGDSSPTSRSATEEPHGRIGSLGGAASVSTVNEPQGATSGTGDETQDQLIKQLTILQETLSKMQATIAEQNAQIADLTKRVARAQPTPAAPTVEQQPASVAAEEDDTDTPEAPRSYLWLIATLSVMTIAILASAVIIRRRGGLSGPHSSARSQTSKTNTASTDKASGPATPSSQQKAMEADGRVQIDWDKEVWNKPEWVKLFGGQAAQAATANEEKAKRTDAPVEAALTAPAPATASVTMNVGASLRANASGDSSSAETAPGSGSSHNSGASPQSRSARVDISPDLEALERSYTLDIETSTPIATEHALHGALDGRNVSSPYADPDSYDASSPQNTPIARADSNTPNSNVGKDVRRAAAGSPAIAEGLKTAAPTSKPLSIPSASAVSPSIAASASPTSETTDMLDPAATLVTEELPTGYLDEMPNAYFSELPKVSQSRSSPSSLAVPDVAPVSDTVIEELTDAMASDLLGEETQKLANAYAAAIRERATANQMEPREEDRVETAKAMEGQTTNLTEVDSADLLDPETAGLSSTGAARLLAGELTSSTQTEMTRLSDDDLASLEAPDLDELSMTDATLRLEAEATDTPPDQSAHTHQSVADSPDSQPPSAESGQVLEIDRPTSPRKFRRSASRR